MPLFLPIQLLGQVSAPHPAVLQAVEIWRSLVLIPLSTHLAIFIVSQVCLIAGYWLVSRKFVRDWSDGRFTNALRAWSVGWFVTIILIMAYAFGAWVLYVAGAVRLAPWLFLALGLFAVIGHVAVPLQIYRVGAIRALGILLGALLISLAGTGLIDWILSGPGLKAASFARRVVAVPMEQRIGLFRRLRDEARVAPLAAELPGENAAANAAKTPQERQAGLRTMFAELERRRAVVRAGDAVALAAYQRQLGRYEELLARLKADVASGAR